MTKQSNTSPHAQLSLTMAILINLNIMLGTGIFINTTELARFAGSLGFAAYLIIGVLMLPLIICIAKLLNTYPSGGFYTFAAQEIHPVAGFASAWSYFVAKLASCALMIHVSMTLIQSILPRSLPIHHFAIDLIIVALFVYGNTMNFKLGSIIQAIFIGFKSIPIATGIILGALLTRWQHFTFTLPEAYGLPATLPLVLYAAVGFESVCALSSRIKNAEKNAARVVVISFGLVIFIACAYQFFFYGALGNLLATLPNYRYLFPALFHTWLPCEGMSRTLLIAFFHLAIACSALGGCYSIIFSNTWNLYTLAQHRHTFLPDTLTSMNRNHIPWLCVVIQGFICAFYLAITHGAQLPLQQINGIGCVIAYTMSTISLYKLYRRQQASIYSYLIVFGALFSCLLLACSCVVSLWYQSAGALVTLASLIAGGMIMFFITQAQKPSPTLD